MVCPVSNVNCVNKQAVPFPSIYTNPRAASPQSILAALVKDADLNEDLLVPWRQRGLRSIKHKIVDAT